MNLQRELEDLLGSTLNVEIRESLSNYIASKAQYCDEGSELNKHSEADPVTLFNGQFTYAATDLKIDGAGIEFAFKRTYKHQAFTHGPLGFNWDYSYNLWIREESNSVVRSSGELREDHYIRHEVHDYFVPPDGYHDTIESTGDSFVTCSPDAVRFTYEREGVTRRHRIKSIVDRNGNYLYFGYDDRSRLLAVEVNAPRRQVTFEYDNTDRIIVMTAYPVTYRRSGGFTQISRQWHYNYNDVGDLIAVIGPASERHADGLSTRYKYGSATPNPDLAHNLDGIVDPDGHLFLENEYGAAKGLTSHNRVIRQRQGSGEYQFEYENVLPEVDWRYGPEELPAHRTIFYQRNGHPVEHVYNQLGNLIVKRETVVDSCDRRELTWRYRYNRDGALVASLTPEGGMSQFLLGRDHYYADPLNGGAEPDAPWLDPRLTAVKRRTFGNVLATIRRGRQYAPLPASSRGSYGNPFPSIFAADSSDVIVKSTFEPNAQQFATVSDPRHTSSADPYYKENQDYFRHLTHYEYTPAPRSNILRVRYPETRFPSSLPDGTSELTGNATEFLAYDTHGRLLRSRDATGSETVRKYFLSGVRDGYLRCEIRDAAGLALLTTWGVNEAGDITAQTNPRGVTSRAVVSEYGQILERVSGGPEYTMRFVYGRNGQLERSERDNVDEYGEVSGDGPEVRTYAYDALNNLLLETLGGSDLSVHHRTKYRYDSSDMRVSTALPRGNRVTYSHDERLLPRGTTRGAGDGEQSTTRIAYDADGRASSIVDGRGKVSRIRRDALGHPVEVTDAAENARQTSFDQLGNPTVERVFQIRSDASYDLLARRSWDYDERANCIREVRYLFDSPIPTSDIAAAPDAEFAALKLLGKVTDVGSEFFYDRSRRLFRILDGSGAETMREYDGAGRMVFERDALGNYSRTKFNRTGNVSRLDRHEIVRDPATGTVLRHDVFSSLSDYDVLDRRTATTDGLGNRTVYGYDSRDNLTSVTNPLENVRRYQYDVYGLLEKEVAEMTADGLGGGVRMPDIETTYRHDENGNLSSVIDATGNTTTFVYDAIDRRVATRFGDGERTHIEYDAADNIVGRTDCNGLRTIIQIDEVGRAIGLTLDKVSIKPGVQYPQGAEESETHKFDGLGRLLLQRNEFVEQSYSYDSLGRMLGEGSHYLMPNAPAGPLLVRSEYDRRGNRVRLIYPNGRELRYYYDALGRLQRIVNLGNGVDYPGSPTSKQQYEVVRYRYRGLRLSRVTLGNGTRDDYTYDGAARLIAVSSSRGKTRLLETRHLHDAAGNRRLALDLPKLPGRSVVQGFSYDSLSRLTRFYPIATKVIDPKAFGPPPAPRPRNALTGQKQIDKAIGNLAQDPADFTYQYDGGGDRTEERPSGKPQVPYSVNSVGQYESVGGAILDYDPNGNLVGNGVNRFYYNYRNRLSAVVDVATGSEVLRIFYGPSGRMSVLRRPNSEAYLLSDGANVLEEYLGSGLAVQYINENVPDRRCQISQSGAEEWYHQDPHRSTRLLTDTAGQVSERYDYEPFGHLLRPVTHPNPYTYGGKRLLLPLDLYDSRARQYSPSLGRFLQRDPNGMADGPNLYAYAGNNPATFIDPLGLAKTGVVSNGESSKFTPQDRAAWAAAEAAGYDFQSMSRLTEVVAEQRITESTGLFNSDVEERYAVTHAEAFRHKLAEGTPQGVAVGLAHLVPAVFHSFMSRVFGSTPSETAVNLGKMAVVGAVLGAVPGQARTIQMRPAKYVSLFEMSEFSTEAPSAMRPQLFEPEIVGTVAGHEITGFVLNGETYYGPYVRLEDTAAAVQAMSRTGELWGTAPRTGFGGIANEAKAFFRPGEPLPANSLEFYTRVKPSNFSPARMGGPRWAEGSPGVADATSGGSSYAVIKIDPIRTGPH